MDKKDFIWWSTLIVGWLVYLLIFTTISVNIVSTMVDSNFSFFQKFLAISGGIVIDYICLYQVSDVVVGTRKLLRKIKRK